MDDTIDALHSTIDTLKSRIALLSAHKESLQTQINNTDKEISALDTEIGKNSEAHALVAKSIQIVYASLSSRLSDIITEGLHCVFPDSPYTRFVIEFVPRRDSIEADLYLIDKDGEEYHPMNAVGGGVADLIALLLRITYIKLSPYEDFIVADEPLKFVDRGRIEDAAAFIHKICNDLEFRLLIITHIPEFIKVSDSIYKVVRKNGATSTTLVTS